MSSFYLTIISIKGMTFTALGTGGEYKHTLSTNEMPSHSHDLKCYTTKGAYNGWSRMGNTQSSDPYNYESGQVANTGGSASHNNLPPYTGIYRWRRIS